MQEKFKDVFITTTDTVLGIGVRVKDHNIELLYELKGRELNKKIIILVGSLAQAQKLAYFDAKAIQMAKKYWPGAVSLIIDGQGFRMPNQKGLIDFLLENGPCYVTSCNKSHHAPIQNLEEAKRAFPQVNWFLDFGKMSQKPSKVIDVATDTVLRD